MRRYTTPTIELTVEGVDLTSMDIYVTIEQRSAKVTFENPDVIFDGTDSLVTVPLTQEQTAQFRVGTIRVQINWLDDQRHRNATDIATCEVGENLLQEVK